MKFDKTSAEEVLLANERQIAPGETLLCECFLVFRVVFFEHAAGQKFLERLPVAWGRECIGDIAAAFPKLGDTEDALDLENSQPRLAQLGLAWERRAAGWQKCALQGLLRGSADLDL